MNKWKIEKEKSRYMDMALSRIIHLHNWWGYRLTPHEVITELKETICYMEHVEELCKEEKDDKQSVKTNPGIENNTASEQSKKGYWGAIGAYCFDKE